MLELKRYIKKSQIYKAIKMSDWFHVTGFEESRPGDYLVKDKQGATFPVAAEVFESEYLELSEKQEQ